MISMSKNRRTLIRQEDATSLSKALSGSIGEIPSKKTLSSPLYNMAYPTKGIKIETEANGEAPIDLSISQFIILRQKESPELRSAIF